MERSIESLVGESNGNVKAVVVEASEGVGSGEIRALGAEEVWGSADVEEVSQHGPADSLLVKDERIGGGVGSEDAAHRSSPPLKPSNSRSHSRSRSRSPTSTKQPLKTVAEEDVYQQGLLSVGRQLLGEEKEEQQHSLHVSGVASALGGLSALVDPQLSSLASAAAQGVQPADDGSAASRGYGQAEGSERMMPKEFFQRLRGLPYNAREREVYTFLGFTVPADCITFRYDRGGKFLGEGVIKTTDKITFDRIQSKHLGCIGKRYIEVFPSDLLEFQRSLESSSITNDPESTCDGQFDPTFLLSVGIVKIRGVPFESNDLDIQNFFRDQQIIPNGIQRVLDGRRQTGEAFVLFASKVDAYKAVEKDRERIGSRYIEVFLCHPREYTAFVQRKMEAISNPGANSYTGTEGPSSYGSGSRYQREGGYGGGYGGGGNSSGRGQPYHSQSSRGGDRYSSYSSRDRQSDGGGYYASSSSAQSSYSGNTGGYGYKGADSTMGSSYQGQTSSASYGSSSGATSSYSTAPVSGYGSVPTPTASGGYDKGYSDSYSRDTMSSYSRRGGDYSDQQSKPYYQPRSGYEDQRYPAAAATTTAVQSQYQGYSQQLQQPIASVPATSAHPYYYSNPYDASTATYPARTTTAVADPSQYPSAVATSVPQHQQYPAYYPSQQMAATSNQVYAQPPQTYQKGYY